MTDREFVEAEVELELQLDPNVETILQYFKFRHLPPGKLRAMSMRFALVAIDLVAEAPRCAERTVALRKLLEGKDAAVRACL